LRNVISAAEAAAEARAGSCPGAVLPEGFGADVASGTGVVSYARPRAVWGVDVFAAGRMATSQDQPLGLQCPSLHYPHKTRIVAASGGALGPHPARDPV